MRVKVDMSKLYDAREKELSEEHAEEQLQLKERQAERRVALKEEHADDKRRREEREKAEKERLEERQAGEKLRLEEQKARAEMAANALCFGCANAWIKISLPPWEDTPRPDVTCLATGDPVCVDTVFACNRYIPLGKETPCFNVANAVTSIKDGKTYVARSQQTEPTPPTSEAEEEQPPEELVEQAPSEVIERNSEAGENIRASLAPLAKGITLTPAKNQLATELELETSGSDQNNNDIPST